MKSRLKMFVEEKCELEMTPMIDVTFLLLIFFMCTIKFKTLEGKLAAYLPKDVGVNSSPAEPKEKVDIVLTVVNAGQKLNAKTGQPYDGDPNYRFEFQGRKIAYKVGPMQTSNIDELKRRLTDLHRADSERPATIDAREGIVNAEVVAVLDAAIQAGYEEITFVGSYQN